jgi:hypothetical protein
VWGEIPVDPDGTFVGGMTEDVADDATVLLLELFDSDDQVLAAATERLPASVTEEPSPGASVTSEPSTDQPTTSTDHVDQPDLTPRAADVRQRILDAARSGDYEQLRPLIGDGFSFSFGDGGGEMGNHSPTADRAIAFWQQDGTRPLEIMRALLEMPYTTQPLDGGRVYIWPGIFTWTPDQLSHLDELAPEWRSALELLYPDFDRQLRSWIEGGGYLGWRIGIADDGRWMFFVAGD